MRAASAGWYFLRHSWQRNGAGGDSRPAGAATGPGGAPAALAAAGDRRQPTSAAANKRYLHSDMNRMFGERWRQFPLSEETQRAQRLEQAVARFIATTMARAGTSICIPRSAGRYIRASACSRPAIRRGRRISSLAGRRRAGGAGVSSPARRDLHPLQLRTVRGAGLHP